MNTQYYRLNPGILPEQPLREAARTLKHGGLVAFPTETVYGLGANGWDGMACKKIYEAKGRPSDNPLILHISSWEELGAIVAQVPPMAKLLGDAFWPGPMTLILPKSQRVPREVTGGLDTVAVRFPSHPVARKLIAYAGVPIAAPSANTSGKPSPTLAKHVIQDLDGKIDMILDGGGTDCGLESTIVDVTGVLPVILRPGSITKEMLEKVAGAVEVDPAVLEKPDPSFVPRAPGMKYTHYSPDADVVIVKGEQWAVIEKINHLMEANKAANIKTGILCCDQTAKHYQGDVVLSLGDRDNPGQMGSRLFSALRDLDRYGVKVAYAEAFEEDGEGMALMNRLRKAAGFQFLLVSQEG